MKETNQLCFNNNHHQEEEDNEEIDNRHNYQSSKSKQSETYKNIKDTHDNSNDNACIDILSRSPEPLKTVYFETDQTTSTDQYWYKRLGNCFAFISNQNGDPLLVIGPHWPMYFFLTSLVTGGIFLYLYFFWAHVSFMAKAYGFITYFCFILCYTYTAVINPGYPINCKGKRLGEPKEEHRFCSDCKFWVKTDKKVNHCLDCDICVEGYDHHCPWTSKCIGKSNKYSFYGFIGSIMLLFGFFLIGIITTPA